MSLNHVTNVENERKEKLIKRKDREDEQSEGMKKKRKIEEIIENLSREIENEREMDNKLRTETEILVKLFEETENIIEWSEGLNELKKIKIYNYAESFQLRIEDEMRKDLSKTDRTTRTKIYREMIKIGNLKEEDNERLRKSTQRAEKYYKVVKAAGGREKIRFLKGISITAIIKLTKEEIEYAIKKINSKGNI